MIGFQNRATALHCSAGNGADPQRIHSSAINHFRT